MGQIFGGIIVMVIFIAFVMWKNKNKPQEQNSLHKINEQQYWDRKNQEKPIVVSSDAEDTNDD